MNFFSVIIFGTAFLEQSTITPKFFTALISKTSCIEVVKASSARFLCAIDE